MIYGIGFLAQLLFSSRLVVQWLLSEKRKRIVTPSVFWKLSLVASFLLFVYGYLRHDLAIMLGQSLTYFIYIRNLHLQGEWQKSPFLLRFVFVFFPLFILLYGFYNSGYNASMLWNNEEIPTWLLVLGIASQMLFTFRFIYQWIYSEKYKISELPIGFWVISACGASLILLYAIFRRDPVLFIGHIAGMAIYIRNIMIGKKQIFETA